MRFGVTPHTYDASMERLYREGYGFIFETLLYGQRPLRRAWNAAVLSRIVAHAAAANTAPAALRILIFGDGCGEDSLYLARNGCVVDYFDLPGSRTFAFASRRFAHHGVLGERVRICSDLAALGSGTYDVLISLEVLEHLPNPDDAIRTMARLLKRGGIALVSEAFDCVSRVFPTHLACNFALRDTTPLLFLRRGFAFSWTNPEQPGKPMEFRLCHTSRMRRIGALLRSRSMLRELITLLRRRRWREALSW